MKHLTLLAFVLLTGCATSYQKMGFSGGFEETQLGPDKWRVSFSGNGYTRGSRATDLALLRCADLTLQQGFKYFVITGGESGVERSAYTAPTTANTTFYGNTAQTNFYGGGTTIISKPSTSNTIVMLKEKPAGVMDYYDASFMCRSLGAKYEARCGTVR